MDKCVEFDVGMRRTAIGNCTMYLNLCTYDMRYPFYAAETRWQIVEFLRFSLLA